MNSPLIIRADGGIRIGTGHVMRCLALAQQWKRRGGRVIFAQVETVLALTTRLHEEGMETVALAAAAGSADDARETIALAKNFAATWIVADGYVFGAAWQKQIKDAGVRLLVVDDYGHAEHYHADIILNQNAGADAALYAHRDPATRLLLGTRYALLRREFLASRSVARVTPERARKILVTLGGSDPDNVTARVVAALAPLADIEAVVVAGGGNPNLPAIRQAVEAAGPAIHLAVNVNNMPELMAWADVAVSAAGSTCWELAFMGLPAALIVLAENQTKIAAKLANDGIAIDLGWHTKLSVEKIMEVLRAFLLDEARRRDMSDRGRQLVDQIGASRIATYLQAATVAIRRATPEDGPLLCTWVNDAQTRVSAFNQETIPWEAHLAWFEGRLRDANCIIYIASNRAGTPLGQARFEWDASGVARVDVSVAQNYRKAGIGSALLRQAVDRLFASKLVDSVCALVKPENQASISAFRNADFQESGLVLFREKSVVQFTMTDTYE